MTPIIRLARPDDLLACVRIVRENWGAEIARAAIIELDQAFRPNDWRPVLFVAETDGAVIGCAAFIASWNWWGVYDVTWVNVAPELQGLGIGKLLVQKCLDAIALLGTTAMLATTRPEFYARCFGFKRAFMHDGDKHIMYLELPREGQTTTNGKDGEANTRNPVQPGPRLHNEPPPASPVEAGGDIPPRLAIIESRVRAASPGDHDYLESGRCVRCGCSKKLIEQMEWKVCNPNEQNLNILKNHAIDDIKFLLSVYLASPPAQMPKSFNDLPEHLKQALERSGADRWFNECLSAMREAVAKG